MSDLKRLMRALAKSIVLYNQEQTKNKFSATLILDKPHQELIGDLEALTNEATSNYKTRFPVLDYLLYLIQTFKPLVDQSTPLEESEYQAIEDNLITFILNMQKLTTLSHSTAEKIMYNKQTVSMSGFIRGITMGYTFCVSAQILEKIVFIPFDLEFDTQESEVRSTIRDIVEEHKAEVTEKFEMQKRLGALESKVSDLEAKLLAAEEKAGRVEELQRRVDELEEVNAELREKPDASKDNTPSSEEEPPPYAIVEKEQQLDENSSMISLPMAMPGNQQLAQFLRANNRTSFPFFAGLASFQSSNEIPTIFSPSRNSNKGNI